MEWTKLFISCLMVLFVSRAWSTELSPPRHLKIKNAELSWDPPRGERNLTYNVQYSDVQEGMWYNVCGCSEPRFNFTPAAENFYGKIFRVQAQRANQTSIWQQSEPVKCQHIETCAPILKLKVETDRVHLWMSHRDESLMQELYRHISYEVLSWKETSANDKQVHKTNGDHLIIESLQSGHRYCFQAKYLAYNKPYGTPSHIQCDLIPETSAERNLRIVLSGVFTVVGLAIFGSCLYLVYKNYKRIKICLQPPLEIPGHIHEFFSDEFSQDDRVAFKSQPELDSNELITLEIRDEYEGRRHEEDISSSPGGTT